MRTIILEPGTRQQIGRSGDTGVMVQFRAMPWHQAYPAGLPYLMVTSPGGVRTPVTVTYADGMISGVVPDELLVKPGLYKYVFAWVSAGEQVMSSPCGALVLDGVSKRWNPHSAGPDWAERIFIAAEAIEGKTEGIIEAAESMMEDLEASRQAASDSEAWANGTRGGVDVDSDDPAYQKNGKYYNTQGASNADAAAASAASAAESASRAMSGTPEGYANLVSSVGDLQSAMDYANHGYELIDTVFAHGKIDTLDGSVRISESNYKYQVVTPNTITYTRNVTLKCNSGYEFLVFWYDDNDTYVSRTGSWGKSYDLVSGRHIRIFVRLDPNDTSADVGPYVFARNIYVTSEIDYRLDTNENDIAYANRKISKANKGQEMIPATFANGRMVDNFPSASANNYKYQAVTLEAVTFTRDVTIKANPGYQFTAYWYNDNDEYVSRNASARTEYVMPSGRHFRLYIQLSPPNTSAVVSPETFKDNVYIISELGERVGNIETNTITTLPAYIKNTLSNKPLGSLSKGYILLSFDDGATTLATGTIPLLIANEVPGTFGLLPQSEIFAEGNESELATVVDAVENQGCVVAMHGSALWPTYTESALYQYFENTVALFADEDLGDTYGAICPGGVGDDTSALVKAVAGGYFGYVFSGNRADKISYDTVSADGKYNGARSNRYDLDRRSGIGITSEKAHDIVTYAAENHLLLCPFWHDNTLNDANHTEYVTYFNDLITEAKAAGLTFITAKDLPNIV